MENDIKYLGRMIPNMPLNTPPLHKVVPNPMHTAFQAESTDAYLNLGEIARKLLEAERAKDKKVETAQDAPSIDKVNKKNPPHVEDKVKSSKLPDSTPKKLTAPVGGKKDKKDAKYTQLSNYIPAEVKRDKNGKPKLTDKKEKDCETCDKAVDGDKADDDVQDKNHFPAKTSKSKVTTTPKKSSSKKKK
jgi:hypothetical protein